MRLFLVGMRAVGKSTVGPPCAERLGLRFVDTDAEVARVAGRSIAELFAEGHEHAFRKHERTVMVELAGGTPAVVATGAGAILDVGVRELLHREPLVVWLRADVEVLRARIRQAPRPSLTGMAPADEVEEVLRRRAPLYAATAHAQIDVTRLRVDEVVDELERLWTLFAHHDVR